MRERRVPGPRVFPVGRLIVGIGGHGAEGLPIHAPLYGAIREASGPDDWREAVREQFEAGADAIKVASHFSREEIRAAVEEAHALGLRVMADAKTFYIQWAVEAGVDDIEHPLPRTDKTIRLMAERGTDAVPTLTTYSYIFDLSGGYFGSTSRRFSFSKEENLELVRRMRRAGIRMGVGTDLVSDWFRFLPGAYITELKQLQAAGYSPAEALVAATWCREGASSSPGTFPTPNPFPAGEAQNWTHNSRRPRPGPGWMHRGPMRQRQASRSRPGWSGQ